MLECEVTECPTTTVTEIIDPSENEQLSDNNHNTFHTIIALLRNNKLPPSLTRFLQYTFTILTHLLNYKFN